MTVATIDGGSPRGRGFVVLQPEPARAGYLPATGANVLWGRLPCETDSAVVRIASGDELIIDTLSHEGVLDDQGGDPVAFFGGHGVAVGDVLADAVELTTSRPGRGLGDGPHVVTGPIAVAGARPGDLLRMTVLEATPRVPYGVISNRHGRGALPGEYPAGDHDVSIFATLDDTVDGLPGRASMARAATGGRIGFDSAPFLGIMGVAVAGSVRPNSVPPGAHGGNIDIRLLTPGTSLYLPVQVPEALAYVGDPHFAQGDGEVALTALEGSLRTRIRFEVIPAEDAVRQFGRVTGPLVVTDEFFIPTGLGDDLDEAMRACVRAAIALLVARGGMDAEHAYAYLSAATDFRISQVVDLVVGVHATISRADVDG